MALAHDMNAAPAAPDLEMRDEDRFTGYETEGDGSNFAAFLMGGVVVAGGLLAFLYYDTDNLNSRAHSGLSTTATVGRIESPAGAPVPSIRVLPPSNGDETPR